MATMASAPPHVTSSRASRVPKRERDSDVPTATTAAPAARRQLQLRLPARVQPSILRRRGSAQPGAAGASGSLATNTATTSASASASGGDSRVGEAAAGSQPRAEKRQRRAASATSTTTTTSATAAPASASTSLPSASASVRKPARPRKQLWLWNRPLPVKTHSLPGVHHVAHAELLNVMDGVFDTMHRAEELYCPDPNMLERQTFITANMRSILLDWLMEVCQEFALKRETFHLACNFIDRFLSKAKPVHRNRLQLVGIAALFTASKTEEIYPPTLREFGNTGAGAYTSEDIKRQESIMIKRLSWDLVPPTAFAWLCALLQQLALVQENEASVPRGRLTPRQLKLPIGMGSPRTPFSPPPLPRAPSASPAASAIESRTATPVPFASPPPARRVREPPSAASAPLSVPSAHAATPAATLEASGELGPSDSAPGRRRPPSCSPTASPTSTSGRGDATFPAASFQSQLLQRASAVLDACVVQACSLKYKPRIIAAAALSAVTPPRLEHHLTPIICSLVLENTIGGDSLPVLSEEMLAHIRECEEWVCLTASLAPEPMPHTHLNSILAECGKPGYDVECYQTHAPGLLARVKVIQERMKERAAHAPPLPPPPPTAAGGASAGAGGGAGAGAGAAEASGSEGSRIRSSGSDDGSSSSSRGSSRRQQWTRQGTTQDSVCSVGDDGDLSLDAEEETL